MAIEATVVKGYPTLPFKQHKNGSVTHMCLDNKNRRVYSKRVPMPIIKERSSHLSIRIRFFLIRIGTCCHRFRPDMIIVMSDPVPLITA